MLKKISSFILYFLVLILSLSLFLPWLNAKQPAKPQPKPWQINGIVAALDDGYPDVKLRALQKLSEYDTQSLKKSLKNNIAQKAINLIDDKSVNADIRIRGIAALNGLGDFGKPYARDIANILKDKGVNSYVRLNAAEALGNLGDAGKPYIKDIIVFLQDTSVDSFTRSRAKEVLKQFGKAAKAYVKDIGDIVRNKSIDSQTRVSAAEVLTKLGFEAKPYAKDIFDLLYIQDAKLVVGYSAGVAVGNLGDLAKPYVKDIVNLVKNKSLDSSVRGNAAFALIHLGNLAQPYVKDILNFVKDDSVNSNVRFDIAYALDDLENAVKPYVKDILDLVKDASVEYYIRYTVTFALRGTRGATDDVKNVINFLGDKSIDSNIRGSAAYALSQWDSAATKPYVKEIINLLKDKSFDSNIRSSVTQALYNLGNAKKVSPKDIDFYKQKDLMLYVEYSAEYALDNPGDAAKPYIQNILNILKDKNVDSVVRESAALALSGLGDKAKPYIKDILNILKDENVDSGVRHASAQALTNFGDEAKPYVKEILNLIQDKSFQSVFVDSVLQSLVDIKQLTLEEVVVLLEKIDSNIEQKRFLTYLLTGGTDEVKVLLKWVANPKETPKKLTHKKGVKTLQVFLKTWKASKDLPNLRENLAKQIAVVTAYKNVHWKPQDIILLQTHYNNLKAVNSTHAEAIKSVIHNLEGWKWFFATRNIIITHIIFWLALILAYPKFSQVQAIFFWNPWIRRILGMGYVGCLLTWVPFLRRKLFEPFKPSLLADARLMNFDVHGYFPQSRVVETRPLILETLQSNVSTSITKAIPSINGQIVLIGDSGNGKSMFLRHLVKTSKQIVVYLPATKCEKGVIEAIQDKLHGQLKDTDFLKSLIYSGALDICIDGLNEVSADIRAQIKQFIETYFRGNIILATQPLEWEPPSTAKIYRLQPLMTQQIEEFLISRQYYLPANAQIRGIDYEKACKDYLKQALDSKQTNEELTAVKRVLSNPMDLTLVALMISAGESPQLFRLQEQQYKLMAAEFVREWGHEFPLKKFSEAVYQMRLNNEEALPSTEFYQELESMENEKYKMVFSRQWKENNGESKQEWYFRHDKIMDFFLLQNFLGDDDESETRLINHIGDSRFRGVYFLLATFLPKDASLQLREKLIQYAADTKDHTVSDTFVQLLRTR